MIEDFDASPDPHTDPDSAQGRRLDLTFAEAILGLIFASFLGVGLFIMVPIVLLSEGKRLQPRNHVLVWVAWGIAALVKALSLRFYGGGLEHATHPVPVSIAMRQRSWPLTLRPLAAAWWLANAAAMVALAEWVLGQYVFFTPTIGQTTFRFVCTAGVLFSSALAANTYLLFAVAALFNNRRWVLAVWRVRILLDLAVAIGVAT